MSCSAELSMNKSFITSWPGLISFRKPNLGLKLWIKKLEV